MKIFFAALVFSCTAFPAGTAPSSLKIGSKKFTESVILGEILTQLVQDSTSGTSAEHKTEMGGTRVLWNALLYGDIDAYPEYLGTLQFELLADQKIDGFAMLQQKLSEKGIGVLPPLGFNNTYAIGVSAAALKIYPLEKLSDLARYPSVRLGLSSEFAQRADGWPALKKAYRLNQSSIRTMDHEIAYRAIQAGEIDALDLYSTDAEIDYYGLKVLKDDRNFFPRYDAVVLYRKSLETSHPKAVEQLRRLSGQIDEAEMIAMNARAKKDREPERKIASSFLETKLGIKVVSSALPTGPTLLSFLYAHILLVAKSLFLAVLIAIPLGILAWHFPTAGQAILGLVGLIQTIPALALLVLLIQPLKALGLAGIGETPAIVALFLYSLLPIVRNTHAGLKSISVSVRESAEALGLSPLALLRRVYLPMASPTILAGVQTAAVINVGFATLGALIGAGGLGQPILTGIRLDDPALISRAAGLAAGLALAVQLGFELLGRWIVPRGMRN